MFDAPHTSQMQRAKGTARLGVVHVDNRTKLEELYQAGCLKLMLPRTHCDLPDAVLINTAGGLTGGDRLQADVSIGDNSKLRLATQTAERIYKSNEGAAHVALSFTLGSAARFDWLAQETILFNNGRVRREINVDMADNASLLMVEPIVLGRLAMNETVEQGFIHDQWRITRGRELVFAEATKLEDFETLKAPALLGEANCLATVLLVDPHAELKRPKVLEMETGTGVTLGTSGWNGMLLVRLLSSNPFELRKSLLNLITLLRDVSPPRVWTM